MRVMDGNLIVPTCLRTPMLILSARRFVQLYYDPDAQGQYASDFPARGQGFLQPRGDIRTSIVPRNFRILPDDVREVVDLYFHREGLDMQENHESHDCTSTDTEAANTVRHLQLHCPAATASLQMAVHEALVPATATRPQEEEYQYDSDDSVFDLDEEYLGLAEWVMQWQAARQGTTCAPPWWPSDFGRPEQSHFNKLPNLRELLNQAEEAKARQRAPRQSVALTPLPFASIRDLDCQCQQRHDQTIAKRQSSPLGGNSGREPKHHHSQTPMMPLMCDVVGKNRIRVGTVVTREQGWIASRNSTGHAAKVGKGQRVAGGVKAGNTVRVGGRRVASVTGAESDIDTNLVGQEFSCHSESGKCPVSPRAEPLKRTCETPGTRRSQMTCPNSGS